MKFDKYLHMDLGGKCMFLSIVQGLAKDIYF